MKQIIEFERIKVKKQAEQQQEMKRQISQLKSEKDALQRTIERDKIENNNHIKTEKALEAKIKRLELSNSELKK